MLSQSTPSGSSASSSAADLSADTWQTRPWVSRVLRVLAVAAPLLGAAFVVFQLDRFFRPSGAAARVIWFAIMIAVSTGVSRVIVQFTRRLLPIAALYKMSLVFPDQAPSRYRMALRRDSVVSLKRKLQSGELSEPQAAAAVVMLVGRLSKHDPQTRGHSERVRAYADVIAEELDLPNDDRQKLQWAAMTHDLGKLTVPTAILNKPSAPDEGEWEVLREHPEAGAFFARNLSEWMGHWALAATEHHERYDGEGYPAGLSGKDISLAGRIVAVADSYDVMTSNRSYKKALSHEAARAELSRNAGSQFDPVVVRAFLNSGVEYGGAKFGAFGSLATLVPRLGDVAGSATAGVTAAAAAVGATIAVGDATTWVPIPDQLAALSDRRSDDVPELASDTTIVVTTTATTIDLSFLDDFASNNADDEADPSQVANESPTSTAPVSTTSRPSPTTVRSTTTESPRATNRPTTTLRPRATTTRPSPATQRPQPTTTKKQNRPTTTKPPQTTTTARPTTTTAPSPSTTTTAPPPPAPVPERREQLTKVEKAEFIGAPANVSPSNGRLSKKDRAFLWAEGDPRQVGSNGLVVDRTSTGKWDGDEYGSGKAKIESGTWICSYLLYWDHPENDEGKKLKDVKIKTTGRVLGVVYDGSKLQASAFLEPDGSSYSYSGLGDGDKIEVKKRKNGEQEVKMTFEVEDRKNGVDHDMVRIITDCGL